MNQDLSAHLSQNAVVNITAWLNEPKYAEYKHDLEHLIVTQQWEVLEDSFFKVLEFGTGGRRGTTGIGSNRINKITMGESAQALCQYAKLSDPEADKNGVVIACDTRLSSKELSEYVASVCAANGFKTYIFESFRSTPELSFTIRHLRTSVGIVVSASHNPPADNGFKAYWSDGAQLVAPHDKGMLDVAASATTINTCDYQQAVDEGKIIIIGSEVDDAYVAAATNEAEGSERNVNIVYSPLHGAGQTNVLPVLRAAGFESISVVEDQMLADGNFPTVEGHKPNPEERIANDRAVAQMMAEDADIAITNDPDADRIGVMARQGNDIIYFDGNQSAVLAADYILQKLQQKAELSNKHYLAKTIVTTDMLNALAASYGVNIYTNMLIGFKYIGELIHNKESTDEIFVMGAEESFGLLKGTYSRDKDGAAGALPLAEYAAELKKANKTLYDRLRELYVEHGLFKERLDNAYFEGASGFQKMQSVMDELRSSPPSEVDGHKVSAVYDYKTLIKRDISSGQETPIDCLAGNVVALEFENDTRKRVTVRPSGTEPKIKLYTQWFEGDIDSEHVDQRIETLDKALFDMGKTLEGVLLD